MTRRELADWLYADDPNGGPENTFAVCQLVHQARLQLTAQGYTIISDPYQIADRALITGWQSYRE
jgi:hypothetical protein